MLHCILLAFGVEQITGVISSAGARQHCVHCVALVEHCTVFVLTLPC